MQSIWIFLAQYANGLTRIRNVTNFFQFIDHFWTTAHAIYSGHIQSKQNQACSWQTFRFIIGQSFIGAKSELSSIAIMTRLSKPADSGHSCWLVPPIVFANNVCSLHGPANVQTKHPSMQWQIDWRLDMDIFCADAFKSYTVYISWSRHRKWKEGIFLLSI